jgi:D-alanyl-D-alanine carboxypeptidase (penicillin-binding protein 5/6)
MTADACHRRPAWAVVSATFRRRNQFLARLAICAAGGLVVGGIIAIPFSGHDDTTAIVSPSDSSAAGTTPASSRVVVPATSTPTGPGSTAPDAGITTGQAATTVATTLPTSASSPSSPSSSSSSPSSSSSASPVTTAGPVATGDPPTSATSGAATVPGVEAAAYLLVDADSGATLAASNAAERHPVGSIMKLLTAYVVMQSGDPTKIVTVPPLSLADDESRIFLSPGQHFARDLLLRAMLIVSAGDAAEALAIDMAGSQQAFVDKMNSAAASLGMTDTHAANADGLDADDGYSTATDVAKLARVLMQDATFRATVSRTSAQLFGKKFAATNTLLGSYPGATGIKTGHTTDAGYCLTASATRNGRSLIAVVIGTPSKQARDATAAAILDWGFAHAG